MLYQVTMKNGKTKKVFKFTADEVSDAKEWSKRQAKELGEGWVVVGSPEVVK